MANGYTVSAGPIKATTTLNILAGIWLFVSPWVYGFYTSPNAWNEWIVGAVIVIFSAIRFNNPLSSRALSYLNMLLGAWVFASPWIYGYTYDTGRFINSLCVGVIVFVLAAYGSAGVGHRAVGTPTGTPPPLRP